MDLLRCGYQDANTGSGDVAVLQQAKLTADEIRQYRAELAALPPLPPMAERLDAAQRFFFWR